MRSLQASEVTRKNRRTSRIILSRRVAQISRSKSLPSDTAREKKEGKFLPSYYSVKYDASNSCIYSIYAHSLLKPVWQTIFRIRHSVEVELLHNQSTASKEWVRGFEKPLTAKPRVKQIIRIPNEGENKNV